MAGGDATCTGPTPASANVPAGGAGVNFAWSCTLADIGEYVFSADADDAAATTSWPAASSASVLSAASGGPNVVTWNLGSTTAAVPGEIITSGYTAGIYGFRGADQTTFRKYGIDSGAWTARANALGTVKQGGALTTDGAGNDLRPPRRRDPGVLGPRRRHRHLDGQGQHRHRTSARAARSST